MGEDATPPRRRQEAQTQESDPGPRKAAALGDTSLRFEPPPRDPTDEDAPKAPPRPRTPAATTPFAPAAPTVASTPFRVTPPRQATSESTPNPPRAATTEPASTPERPAAAKKAAPPAAEPTPVAAKKAAPVKKAAAKKATPAKKAAEAAPAIKSAPPAAEPPTAPEPPAAMQEATPANKAAPVKKATPIKKAAAVTKTKKAAPTKETVEEVPPAAEATPPAKKAAKATKAAQPAEPVKKAVAKKAPAKKAAVTKATSAMSSEPIVEQPQTVIPAPRNAPAATAPEPQPVIAAAGTKPEAAQIQPKPEVAAVEDEQAPAPTPAVSIAAKSDEATGGINPAYLPESLAIAAVERLGAGAKRRVDWYKVTYPDADGDALSRAITREFVRRARRQGFAAGLVGPTGLVVEAAGVAWLQAKLVLHLAAAYGHDPEDRRRAAELLVLQRVHGSVETAEAAVMAAERTAGRRASRRVGADRVSAPLARMVGAGLLRAAATRIARRFVPGAGLVVGSVTAARSTERLAARAVRYYRGFRG
ncbi:hypothetical protein [Dactylosporangium sp. CS-033363]|uniref:hypothetical protein n=1 Tax=Dactylosporangium sp. CS-033363 TaxID=3239935 RepID=UPI003D8BDB68